MSEDSDTTPEDFERLLRWLDQESVRAGGVFDRERAGARYEKIRRRLILICASRGCREAEERADEAIRRVTRKVSGIDENWDGNDPVSYFLAVLDFVLKEHWRRKPLPPPPPPPAPPEEEAAYRCLDACLARLPHAQRELVLRYYQDDQRAKIEHRKRLADELGIALNALRIRVHRIRLALEKCVRACLEGGAAV